MFEVKLILTLTMFLTRSTSHRLILLNECISTSEECMCFDVEDNRPVVLPRVRSDDERVLSQSH